MYADVTRRQLDQAIAEIRDMDDVEIREHYSGRFMYGKTCVGVVGEDRAAMTFILALAEAVHDDDWSEIKDFILDLVDGMKTDSMGLSRIFYWPDLEVRD